MDNVTSIKEIMAERFPEFDHWYSSHNGPMVQALITSDPSALMEALTIQLTRVLEDLSDRDGIATLFLGLFFFGIYMGQTAQARIKGIGDEVSRQGGNNGY